MAALTGDWEKALAPQFQMEYYRKLYHKVLEEYNTRQIFPPSKDLLNAFTYTPLKEVKVVILGQDPYPGDGQAHGLCFSVQPDVPTPKSLQNIYRELQDDLGCYIPDNGNLVKWAKQGVLLLNTVLTVRAHEPNSHQGIGWEVFTDAVIDVLNKEDHPIVFLLWGAPAGRKKAMITNPKHLVLTTSHPSPLSVYRGFSGCRHFSKCNQYLESQGLTPIDWQIENRKKNGV